LCLAHSTKGGQASSTCQVDQGSKSGTRADGARAFSTSPTPRETSAVGLRSDRLSAERCIRRNARVELLRTGNHIHVSTFFASGRSNLERTTPILDRADQRR
jgi:hypothetical protein